MRLTDQRKYEKSRNQENLRNQNIEYENQEPGEPRNQNRENMKNQGSSCFLNIIAPPTEEKQVTLQGLGYEGLSYCLPEDRYQL